MSDSEVAEPLYAAETTIKPHVGRILAELGRRDRVPAVVLAYGARTGPAARRGVTAQK
jgi:DNA-binding NarL/FixJ family response regulator